MKIKERTLLKYFKKWGLLTIATFLLYNILWLPAYYKDFSFNWFKDVWGLCCCAIFTLSSLCIQHFFLRVPAQYKLSRIRLFANGILTFVSNLTLALGIDHIAHTIWPLPFDISWHYTYIWCILTSIVVQFYMLRYYSELIIQQQNENLTLTKNILKSQLGPHFVFNCINILLELIDEAPKRAEKFALSMSKIYRYIINSFDKDLVPATDALAVTKEYVSIFQVRYPSSISLTVRDSDFSKDEKILSMSLQLLIENAVKHNCPTPEHPLAISIYRCDGDLIVRNTLSADIQDHIDTTGSGVGLSNLTRRCLMECGRKPAIRKVKDNEKLFFEVSIPIIKKS